MSCSIFKHHSNSNRIYTILLSFIVLFTVLNYFLIPKRTFNFIIESSNGFLSIINDRPRILCLILTTPENLNTKCDAIYATWAHKCTNYKFITVLPSSKSSSNHLILNENEMKYNNKINVLQPLGHFKEVYENLTHKVFHTFTHIRNDELKGKQQTYDWYLKADDDTFIEYNNLITFLTDKNVSEPSSFGFKMKLLGGYFSGGAGYVLSRESFQRLSDKLISNYSYCSISPAEDVDVGRCLTMLNVTRNNSTDNFGRERFHPWDIESHFKGSLPIFMNDYAENELKKVIFFY
jgi:glycoprotein-N-acetylgalactosamine 3-beta-galactosyltransferase